MGVLYIVLYITPEFSEKGAFCARLILNKLRGINGVLQFESPPLRQPFKLQDFLRLSHRLSHFFRAFPSQETCSARSTTSLRHNTRSTARKGTER